MSTSNRKWMHARKLARELPIFAVGFGGMCGECDKWHEPDPMPFAYTVGLTKARWPELLVITPTTEIAACRAEIDQLCPDQPFSLERFSQSLAKMADEILRAVAYAQFRRGKPFADGEHVHGHQLGRNHGCVALLAREPSENFMLGGAIQQFGAEGYRIMQVLLHGRDRLLQDDPMSRIYAPTARINH
jgi:hypothetical protein